MMLPFREAEFLHHMCCSRHRALVKDWSERNKLACGGASLQAPTPSRDVLSSSAVPLGGSPAMADTISNPQRWAEIESALLRSQTITAAGQFAAASCTRLITP